MACWLRPISLSHPVAQFFPLDLLPLPGPLARPSAPPLSPLCSARAPSLPGRLTGGPLLAALVSLLSPWASRTRPRVCLRFPSRDRQDCSCLFCANRDPIRPLALLHASSFPPAPRKPSPSRPQRTVRILPRLEVSCRTPRAIPWRRRGSSTPAGPPPDTLDAPDAVRLKIDG